MMANLDVDHLVAGLKEYFVTPEMEELIGKLKDGGFKLSKIVTGVALVFEAIKKVEELAADITEVGGGGEKKKAVQKFLDDAIDLPFWMEPLDGPVIGIVIDAVVLYYNTKIGHNWLGVVKQFL